VSDSEVIFDDSRRAIEKARESGTRAQISIWHDVPHNFYYLSFLPECKKFREQMLGSMKTALELQQTADDIDRSSVQMF
jgi:epsilon-lactone hydrolase